MSLKFPHRLTSGVLVLSVCLLAVSSSYSADDPDEKKANKEAADAVLKLAKGSGNAQDIAKKNQIEYVMHGFKLRNKGGIGVGAKAGAVTPDGIEAKIINLAKKALQKGDLAKEADGLTQAAKVTKAIADISEFYAPKEKKADKDPKEWKKYNDDMKMGADALIDAIKSGDPMKVKMAAGKLNQSCNECHGKFRDSN
jgi:cytochrome c556